MLDQIHWHPPLLIFTEPRCATPGVGEQFKWGVRRCPCQYVPSFIHTFPQASAADSRKQTYTCTLQVNIIVKTYFENYSFLCHTMAMFCNGDQSGQWRSVSLTSQWPLIMISQWVLTLLGMHIVKSQWVLIFAREIHCDVTMSNDLLMCIYHGIKMCIYHGILCVYIMASNMWHSSIFSEGI